MFMQKHTHKHTHTHLPSICEIAALQLIPLSPGYNYDHLRELIYVCGGWRRTLAIVLSRLYDHAQDHAWQILFVWLINNVRYLCAVVQKTQYKSPFYYISSICGVTILGAVHKVRHARGEEGSEKGWQFVTGEGGKEHVTSHLYFFIIHMKHEI